MGSVDDAISELNRNTRPNKERRVDTIHELRLLRTQVKYMFYTVIISCIITISLLFYTMKHIEMVCASNSVRYLSILDELRGIHDAIEFSQIPTRPAIAAKRGLNE